MYSICCMQLQDIFIFLLGYRQQQVTLDFRERKRDNLQEEDDGKTESGEGAKPF